MEVGDLIGMAPVKLFLQKVGKEPMIAKPLAAVVQRHEEQVLAFQAFQHLLAAFPPGDGIA